MAGAGAWGGTPQGTLISVSHHLLMALSSDLEEATRGAPSLCIIVMAL